VTSTDAPLDAAPPLSDAPDPQRIEAPKGRGFARAIVTRVAALAIFIAAWQVVVMTGWKPEYLIPSPFTVFDAILHGPGAFTHNAGVTLVRAAIGFGAAIAVGVVLGSAAAILAPLRAPVRSITKGMGTLPAIVWFPAAMIVIGLTTPAILLVVVIAAAPPIAGSVIDGVEATSRRPSPTGEEAQGGRLGRLRHVVVPGALPDVLAGLRSGWGLCWAALLTGELLLTLASLGLGGQLIFERGLNDYVALYEVMVVIFIIGVLVDAAFGGATALLRARQRHAIQP
jgi:NitT/TauT family transport system permease protein